MGFIEGQRAAEDDEHTEVSIIISGREQTGYMLTKLVTDRCLGCRARWQDLSIRPGLG